MGTITRSLANNITTGGVILPAGITNASISAVTSFANASGGILTLLSTQTASNSASISFTSGLDSTYDAYEFKFINIAPRTDSSEFQFNFSTDGGSNYNVTKTTTMFIAYHTENDAETILTARNEGLAQSTAFQIMSIDSGNDADQNLGGFLELYNPSSTTYVKHFVSRVNYNHQADYSIDSFTSGYGNTTSAINAIQFKFDSGNMDGIIKLYGVKKS
jgi:hypothetical protein